MNFVLLGSAQKENDGLTELIEETFEIKDAWSSLTIQLPRNLNSDSQNELNLILERSRDGWNRIDNNALSSIQRITPPGLYYEFGAGFFPGATKEGLCLKGYRYARNPSGRSFSRGFKRCSISHQQNISLKNNLQKFLFEPIQLHGLNHLDLLPEIRKIKKKFK